LVVGVIALPVIVPLLLNVPRNVEGLDYRRLRSVGGLLVCSAFVWCGSCLCVRVQLLPLDATCLEEM